MTQDHHSRPGGRSARNREAVLTATRKILAESGAAELTIATIAERAGVHPTSIYRRWHSVAGVLLDVALDAGALAVPVPDTGNFAGDLREILRNVAAFLTSPVGTALLRHAAIGSPDSGELRAGYRASRLEAFTVVVRRGQDRGEVPSGLHPADVLEFAVAPIHDRVLLSELPVDDEFLEATQSMLLAGLLTTERTEMA